MSKLYFLFFLMTYAVFGQFPSKISNIQVNQNSSTLEIYYAVDHSVFKDSLFLIIERQDGSIFVPKSVKGHVGRGIKVNNPNKIIWDMQADNFELEGQIKAIIKVSETIPNNVSGAGATLVSIVAPGVGNYLVTRKNLLPKLALTSVFYGLGVYAFKQKEFSNQQYKNYISFNKIAIAEPYYQSANTYHHHYYVASRLAGAIWFTEILATYTRGLKNKTFDARPKLSIENVKGVPAFGINYKF